MIFTFLSVNSNKKKIDSLITILLKLLKVYMFLPFDHLQS